jgi:integration host factor subunit alpha
LAANRLNNLFLLFYLKGKLMTVTKEHLVESILSLVDNRKKAIQIIETVLKTTTQSLENGEDVLLSGFGKFSVKDKPERRGRNPLTGEDLMLDARRVITFKPSGGLVDKLNN